MIFTDKQRLLFGKQFFSGSRFVFEHGRAVSGTMTSCVQCQICHFLCAEIRSLANLNTHTSFGILLVPPKKTSQSSIAWLGLHTSLSLNESMNKSLNHSNVRDVCACMCPCGAQTDYALFWPLSHYMDPHGLTLPHTGSRFLSISFNQTKINTSHVHDVSLSATSQLCLHAV